MSSLIILQVGRLSRDKIEGRWITTDTRRAVMFKGKELRSHNDKNAVDTLYQTDDGRYVAQVERTVDDYDERGSKVTFYHVCLVEEKDLRPGGRWSHVAPDLPPMPLADYLEALSSNEPRWT